MDIKSRDHRRNVSTRLVHAEQLRHGVAQRLMAGVVTGECDLRHRVVQHSGTDWVSFGVVRVEQAVGRCPLDHLGKLPAEVHGVLHADVEALAALGRMHVRGITCQKDTPLGGRRQLGASCQRTCEIHVGLCTPKSVP